MSALPSWTPWLDRRRRLRSSLLRGRLPIPGLPRHCRRPPRSLDDALAQRTGDKGSVDVKTHRGPSIWYQYVLLCVGANIVFLTCLKIMIEKYGMLLANWTSRPEGEVPYASPICHVDIHTAIITVGIAITLRVRVWKIEYKKYSERYLATASRLFAARPKVHEVHRTGRSSTVSTVRVTCESIPTRYRIPYAHASPVPVAENAKSILRTFRHGATHNTKNWYV